MKERHLGKIQGRNIQTSICLFQQCKKIDLTTYLVVLPDPGYFNQYLLQFIAEFTFS